MDVPDDLISISQHFGKNKDYIIAGGGNTSYKDNNIIYIKASGTELATITEEGFVALDRQKVKAVMNKTYNSDPHKREEEVKNDLLAARLAPEKGQRPSVETNLHEFIPYSYVVHTHPNLICGVLCSKRSREVIHNLFGNEVLYVSFDPGYRLAKRVARTYETYYEKYHKIPQIYFLENHGIFIGANSTQEIKELYEMVYQNILKQTTGVIHINQLKPNSITETILPQILALFTDQKYIKSRHHSLCQRYYRNPQDFEKIKYAFTPDILVYCKSAPLYCGVIGSNEEILSTLKQQLERYIKRWQFYPNTILLKDIGMICVGSNEKSVNITLDTFEDQMKISYYAEFFGGQQFLTEEAMDFLEHWEVEHYRRQVSEKYGET